MSASPAREVARAVLTEVRTRDAWAHETTTVKIREAGLDQRDSAFATRLAYGTLNSLGTLDEAIARVAQRASRIEPKVADALRVSAYEALFTDTPERVVVSQGVDLVRSVSPRAAGFANAVLRRLTEARSEFPWGDPAEDNAALARQTAHPLWIAELAMRSLGDEAAREMLAADNLPAPLFLAPNPFLADDDSAMGALSSDGAEPRLCDLPGCVEAGVPGAAVRGQALASGLVIAADAGAQAAVILAHPKPDTLVVEIGAGRGTKSLLLQAAAGRAGGVARVLGVDVHVFKSELFAKRMSALRVPSAVSVVADATDPDALAAAVGGTPDVVFVDAPCSGLGTLRRHPDKRWRVQPEEIESLAVLGASLLEASASLVRSGGVVVYSTCTVSLAENEAVIEAFLASPIGAAFRLEHAAGFLPDSWSRFITPEGYLKSWPTEAGPDGHFAARLVHA